jgi:hypothetical protein
MLAAPNEKRPLLLTFMIDNADPAQREQNRDHPVVQGTETA